jgi:hypothetical protein
MPAFVSSHQTNRRFGNSIFLGQRIVWFGLNLLANAGHHFPRQASAAIMSLLARRCPPAIVWAISLVVVFSVQSQCFAIAVSGSPLLETHKISPFVTDNYPSPAVTVVSSFIGVRAPLVHSLPNFVKPAARLAVHDFGLLVAAKQTEISGIGAIRPTLNNNAARGARKRVGFMLCHSHSVDESFGCVNAYGTGFLTDEADEE